MERVHTQTLAWLLNAADSPLALQERRSLLEALGCQCSDAEVQELVVYTELMSLDLIACTRRDVVLVLENKLKSRQSELQLQTYDKTVETVARALRLDSDRVEKVFLTISREVSGGEWNDMDYQVVANALRPMPIRAYVSDYLQLLEGLLNARDAFIADHRMYPQILGRVAWSTLDRLAQPLPPDSNDTLRFIDRNRLERILVETLYRDVCAAIPNTVVDLGRAGEPLIQVAHWRVQFGDEIFRAGLQLQHKSLKLNIASTDYNKSRLNPALAQIDEYMAPFGLRRNAAVARSYRSWSWEAPPDLKIKTAALDRLTSALSRESNAAALRWQQVFDTMRTAQLPLVYEPWPEEAGAGPLPLDPDAVADPMAA